MSEYPNDHVYIIKVKNQTYIACLTNNDSTRVKFLHSSKIVEVPELKRYIQSVYGKEPEWIRCMGSWNMLVPHPKSTSLRSMGCSSSPEHTGIREEINKKIGTKPSTDPFDYDSVYDDNLSCRKEQKAREKRMKNRLAEYEAKASQYPSFSRPLSVTDEEICEVMEWFSLNEKDTPSYNFGSCLDF